MLTAVLFLGWYGLVLQLAHEKKKRDGSLGTVVGLLTGQSLCADACVHRPQSFGGLCFRSLLPQEYVRAFFEGRAGTRTSTGKKKVSLESEGMSNAAHKIPAARRTSSSSSLLACLLVVTGSASLL